jgi:hypothetical protein
MTASVRYARRVIIYAAEDLKFCHRSEESATAIAVIGVICEQLSLIANYPVVLLVNPSSGSYCKLLCSRAAIVLSVPCPPPLAFSKRL